MPEFLRNQTKDKTPDYFMLITPEHEIKIEDIVNQLSP